MKTIKMIATLSLVAMLFTSCDFVRSILGKPTSKELEKMRLESIEQAKRQRQIDSIKLADAAEKARLEAAAKAEAEALKGRYYIILGSFKVQDNAARMLKLLEKDGYTPRDIRFKNGFELIAAAAYDNYREAFVEMDKMLEYEFCPDDVWIYDTQQMLHEVN